MKVLGIIIVIVVLAGLGYYFYSSNYQAPGARGVPTPAPTPIPTPTPTPTPIPPIPTPSTGAKEVMVEMTASGFSPSSLTLKAGDAVRFVNKDTKNHWPASAVHPTHQCYPGFDALGAVAPGASYVFTFNVAKTCVFHDHLNPGSRGSITVQ